MRYVLTAADKLAIERGCYFDQTHADRIIKFAHTYFAPQYIGGKFQLLPWQVDWLSQLYGWRNADGSRRFRRAFLTIAKKNGKSLISSIVALYETLASGVPSPLVVSASTTKENARQIYDEVKNSINRSEKLRKQAKLAPSLKKAVFPRQNAEFRSISNDSGNAEGLNLSACICDELHAWQGDTLYRTLEYSTIARPDGILICISTAGHDQGHFFYDLYSKAKNVLKGDDLDTTFFATIYETPEDADLEEPKNWKLANPSLGTSFSEESFRNDYEAAKKDTASLLSFRRYRLNQWVRAEDSYIDPIKWDSCYGHVSEETLRNAPLFVGCDLSQTTDPCSISCVWVLPDRRFVVRSHAWVCEDGVKRREVTNLPKYRQFQAEGSMTITPGSVNDYRKIRAYLYELRQKYQLKEVVFDQYNALEMATELLAEGFNVLRQPQGHKNYSAPVKEFEIAVNERRITHDGNKLLRWALQNTRLDLDTWGNAKPSRQKSTDKIDPCVSLLMAFGRAVETSVNGSLRPSVYANRGILVV